MWELSPFVRTNDGVEMPLSCITYEIVPMATNIHAKMIPVQRITECRARYMSVLQSDIIADHRPNLRYFGHLKDPVRLK